MNSAISPKTPNSSKNSMSTSALKLKTVSMKSQWSKHDVQENAETLIISYGIVARSVENAVKRNPGKRRKGFCADDLLFISHP